MRSFALKYIAAAAIGAVLGIAAVDTFGQDNAKQRSNLKENYSGFCTDDNWSGDHVSFRELREVTLPNGGAVNVDAGQNGGIAIRGEDRSDVLVRSCVQAWGTTETEAKARVSQVSISTSGTIKADSSSGDKNWSVSFQVLVPRSTNLDLTAHNGGISISGVDGTARFETVNGGVSLKEIAGDFKGHTTNGGVNVVLSGSAWRGNGLDVTTTNGGVRLLLPGNYSAHVETGTVNGGFSSNIAALNVDSEERRGSHAVRINTDINGGGPMIRVITTNGGVRIASDE